MVEHFHGKEGVSSSNLEGGSIFLTILDAISGVYLFTKLTVCVIIKRILANVKIVLLDWSEYGRLCCDRCQYT